MDTELHKSSYEQKDLAPDTVQQEPLCSEKKRIFSDQTLTSLKELGSILERIHKRLVSEGYTIKDGKIFKEIDPVTQNETN